MPGYVSEAVIRRLPAYYRYLRELETAGVTQISSHELGDLMQLNPSQIRQDINSFGGLGRQGYGYPVKELKAHIREIMGLNLEHRMIAIGAGHVGNAVANYTGFAREGFPVVAMFDVDPQKISQSTPQVPVYPVEELGERLPGLNVKIAVLALPAEEAQEILDRLYAAGIRAVWNFSPVDLHYPQDMVVVNVHLSDSLHTLSFRMNQMEAETNR